MEQLVEFGKRLKALRRERKQTQRSMGELLGCTASNYQKIEYGQINIPISSLMILADYFEVTTDDLLGRSSGRAAQDPRQSTQFSTKPSQPAEPAPGTLPGEQHYQAAGG